MSSRTQTSQHSEAQQLLPDRHQNANTDTSSEIQTLLFACILSTVFFLVELVGGYAAGSLAIMSDAAHLLSDLAGFIISLVAVSISRLPANEHLSFGYARAEVLGAFVSILLIWALTLVLVVLAIYRLFNPEPVNGPFMLLLGVIGLVINLCLGFVLGHSHSHGGHGHDHGHVHHHSDIEAPNYSSTATSEVTSPHECDHHAHDTAAHSHDEDDHHHSHSKFSWEGLKAMLLGDDSRSVNLRAAYLHVLGDALQSVGVIVAALFITFKPTWSVIDPLCTLFFAVIVVFTTISLAKETMGVLMEGTPSSIALADIYQLLQAIPGVEKVGDLHVWSITPRIPAMSVHLYQAEDAVSHEVLKEAQHILESRFGITHATIQINCNTTECCDEKMVYRGAENCVLPETLLSINAK